MRLSFLLNHLISLSNQEIEVIGLTQDSRTVKKNYLFFALKGEHTDGQNYISMAIQNGACAVLVDASDNAITYQNNIPIIAIKNLMQEMGAIVAKFYQYPSQHLKIFGVTGTSGKTSCTHFIAQGLQALNIPCGLIGTLGSGVYGKLKDTGFTTPDALTLQTSLSGFVQENIANVAMEVSSHSIHQGRINSTEFFCKIFTNLSQDHLDYHQTLLAYGNEKKKFLKEFPSNYLVINLEDAHAKQWLLELTATEQQIYCYSTQFIATELPLTYCKTLELTLQGIHAEIVSPWGEGKLFIPLIGLFNLSNCLAVLNALCLYGIAFPQVLAALAQITAVPGRMEMVTGKKDSLIVIDYAHKPDALEKVLEALRKHTKNKLICVFGCGGERDKSKRPLMAKIAERGSDQVIVTNDNPRHESPEIILQDIMQGFLHPENVSVELNRAAAIKQGLEMTNQEDCLLIAGKGAEQYQLIGNSKNHFSDIEEVNKYLLTI